MKYTALLIFVASFLVCCNDAPIVPEVEPNAVALLAKAGGVIADDSVTTVPHTLVRRDEVGGVYGAFFRSDTGGDLHIGSDGMQDVVFDGNGTGMVLIPAGVMAHRFVLDADELIERVLPLNWRSATVGKLESWKATLTGGASQSFVDPTAELYVQLDFPHDAKLQLFSVKSFGDAAGGAPPANLPAYNVIRQNVFTMAQQMVCTKQDAGGSQYHSPHWTSATCDDHIVDAVDYRYYLLVTPEYGQDATTGFTVAAIRAAWMYRAGHEIGIGWRQ